MLHQGARADEDSAGLDRPWLDDSHDYVSDQADNLAAWMDSFFGVNRVDEEAPYSTLRLRLEPEWDEIDGWDTGISLRGKVHLPNLNKRVSLLFSDDDERTGSDDLLIDRQNAPDDIALQLTARERENDRIDFKLGLRSTLHPKASVRYRYEKPLSEAIIGRFSQEALYRTDDGFATETRVDLDTILDEDKVLQWTNRLRWFEDEPGLSWNTGLSLNRRLSNDRVLGYYLAIAGATEPGYYTRSYGFGLRYRQNIFRKWLFAELQPSYFWRRDEFEDRRQGSAAILLRLEAVFTRDWD
tara:strand:+ start:43121 stop:44014 length:894 start_codon:yes stop_codon:yes gene_type:complete